MAASEDGDSLYVATLGAGIGRIYRNNVDGISGASPYAKWGPCLLPSDNIHSICIMGNKQWYGTDAGLASHDGNDYMENWAAYTTENGLVDNFVQALAVDSCTPSAPGQFLPDSWLTAENETLKRTDRNEVSITASISPEEWDAYVASHPRSTHYHQHAWRDVIRRNFGHDTLYIGARDAQGSLTGILAAVQC